MKKLFFIIITLMLSSICLADTWVPTPSGGGCWMGENGRLWGCTK